jgi:hypothetical protein
MKEIKKLIGINAHSKLNNRRSLACSYGFNLFYSINARKYYILENIKRGKKYFNIIFQNRIN